MKDKHKEPSQVEAAVLWLENALDPTLKEDEDDQSRTNIWCSDVTEGNDGRCFDGPKSSQERRG